MTSLQMGPSSPEHAASNSKTTLTIRLCGMCLVGGLSAVSLVFTFWSLHVSHIPTKSADRDGAGHHIRLGGAEGITLLPRNMVDFEVYRAGAQALVHHHSLYNVTFSTSEHDLPFTYPPFAACVMVGFLVLPMAAGLVAHSIVSLGAILLATVILTRHWEVRWRYLAAAMVVVSEPVRATLSFGQVNSLLLLLVVCDWWVLAERPPRCQCHRMTGVLTGIAAAVKLTPAVFILVPLLRRDYASTVRCLFSFAVATGLAAVAAPHDSWSYISHVVWATDRIGEPTIVANQSVKGVLGRATASFPATWAQSGMTSILWAGVISALLLMLLLVARHISRRSVEPPGLQDGGKHSHASRYVLPSMVALVGLLASPVSWTHHWVWALPVIVTLCDIAVAGPSSSMDERRQAFHVRSTWFAVATSGIFLVGAVWWAPALSQWAVATVSWIFPDDVAYGGRMGNVVESILLVISTCLRNVYVLWAGFAFVILVSVARSPAQRRRRNIRSWLLYR
ncbi:glycosyltransferase 87 family protein [Corynebacterium kroppenstedtii]|uniref:glycosyltransferase 87 family protein n=1 Tax=Corynebacterium sp. PCR 32 TaxID=3351342 RepID=UPI003098B3B4